METNLDYNFTAKNILAIELILNLSIYVLAKHYTCNL